MSTIGAGPRRLLAGILVTLILPGIATAAPQRKSLSKPIAGMAARSGESGPLRNLPLRRGSRVDEQFQRQLAPDIEGQEINELNTEGTGALPNPNAPPQRDGALQPAFPRGMTPLIPSPSLTFEGLSAADNTTVYGTTVAPPDPNGAVGPSHYVETTNNLVRVYDKNGNALGPAFKQSDLFAALGGICATNNQGDPIVLYDRIASRWLISQFAFASISSPPYHQCIAISKNSDPTDAYWLYDFITPGSEFPDYPKFGVWPDGYYYSDRQFTNGGPFNSFGVFAFERAKMLAGDPTAVFIYFNLGSPNPLLSNASSGMVPSDFSGLTPPPPGAPNTFSVFTDDAFGDPSDALRLFDFHADFAVPANSTFLERSESPLLVASFDSRNPTGRADIEEPPPAAGTDSLDSIGDRLMYRLQYLNRAGNESLLVTQTVNAGTIPPPGILPTRAEYKAGARYYELRKTSPGGAYTVPEQATFSPDTNERWMGSVTMDNAGNIAAGFSLSSTAVFPSLSYAGRLASDPPGGLFQGEATMFSGTGSQLGTVNRWGDYSSLSLDPSDDATFWYVNEYYAASTPGGFDWHTRIGRFKFAGSVAPPQGTLSGTVTTCDTGLPLADVIVTVTGGPSDGFSAATAADGTYSMNLTPGTYQAAFSNAAHSCSGAGPVQAVITNGGSTVADICLAGTPKFTLISEAVSGGNGDATIDANECFNLGVSIENIGCLIAPGVTAVLSTSTPNVTVNQPNTSFPTMNENATSGSNAPFTVTTSASLVCGTTIDFLLTITSPAGGSVALPFSLPTCTLPPVNINGSLAGTDLQQTARLGRNGIASVCGVAKPNPGTLGSGPRLYDLYSFTNGPTSTCVKIDTTASCDPTTNPIITVAYLNSFNPADITQFYLGDPGGSPFPSNSFAVDVPAGATLLVNVHEINAGLVGCSGYSLTVSGLVGNTDGGGTCVTVSPTPAALVVDFAGNQVLEVGETVIVSPAWTNNGSSGQTVSGTASSFLGPPGLTPSIVDPSASYGLIGPGATSSCESTADCYSMMVTGTRPEGHVDLTFDESLLVSAHSAPLDSGKSWKLHLGESFTDTPISQPFYRFIETIFHNGVTAGCQLSPPLYCPDSSVTRAQMAVFLLKGKLGSSYVPPACTGTVFNDVPCTGGIFDPWIEDLAGRGITAGCQVSPPLYCPDSSVTRAQMAVFLLKASLGTAYTPPACTGTVFNDVPCPPTPQFPFSDWIEDLAARGITAGCQLSPPLYCPDDPNTRGQMAVFLTKTFGLLLYGP